MVITALDAGRRGYTSVDCSQPLDPVVVRKRNILSLHEIEQDRLLKRSNQSKHQDTPY